MNNSGDEGKYSSFPLHGVRNNNQLSGLKQPEITAGASGGEFP